MSIMAMMLSYFKNFTSKKSVGLWIPSVCANTCWTHPFYLPNKIATDKDLMQKVFHFEKKQLNKANQYVLVGGGVLDYPYLDQLLDAFKKINAKVSLYTHLVYDRELLQKYFKYFEKIQVQLPVADKESFMDIVGLDFYEQYRAHLQYLAQEFPVELVLEVTPNTVAFLPEAVDEAFYLNVPLQIYYQPQGFSKDELKHILHFRQKKYVQVNRIKAVDAKKSGPCRWAALLCDHVIL